MAEATKSKYKPGQTRWNAFTEALMGNLEQSARQNPIVGPVMFSNDLRKAGAKYLNTAPVPLPPPPAPKPGAKAGLILEGMVAPTAAKTQGTPIVAPLPAAPEANSADPATLFAAALGGPVTVTSGYRTPAHNAKVGGVKGSDHTKKAADGSPMAWDIQPPKGMTTTQAAEILAQQGFGTIDEGDHVHVSKNPVQVARGALQGDSSRGFHSIAPTVAVGDPLNAGGVVAPDPGYLMGMVKDPRLVGKVDIPDAPQRELPADSPLLAMLDKAGLLQDITAAAQVKPRDGKHDAWDRVAAMLQGAAGAAAGADPMAGTGAFLARAGAGGAAGFTNERKEQTQEQLKNEEAQRQVKLMLAKMGFDVDMTNVERTDTNADRTYKSGELKKDVKFQNSMAQFEANLNELMTNLGITKGNIGELNQTDRARSNIGIQATQGLAGAQNRANEQQTQLNVAAENRDLAGAKNVDTELDNEFVGMGLDPKSKDPLVQNARQTLIAANAKQPEMAIAGLARELVLSGKFEQEFAAADAQKIKKAIQQKDATGAYGSAASVLGTLMNNPKTAPAVMELIDRMAAEGMPSAVIISKKRVRDAAPAQQ